jgi:hypothetical protein
LFEGSFAEQANLSLLSAAAHLLMLLRRPMPGRYCFKATKSVRNDDRATRYGLLRLLAAFADACWQSWQVPTDGAWIGTDSEK